MATITEKKLAVDYSSVVFTDRFGVLNVLEESTLQDLRGVEHRDSSGNVIGKLLAPRYALLS